jgi:hypothetical protein
MRAGRATAFFAAHSVVVSIKVRPISDSVGPPGGSGRPHIQFTSLRHMQNMLRRMNTVSETVLPRSCF